MNISMFSFPVNLNIDAIFKAQLESLAKFNINNGDQKADGINPSLVDITEANISNSYVVVVKEFESIRFYDAPIKNEDYLIQRSEKQNAAQSAMQREASLVRAISGCDGSHVGQATLVIKEKVDREVKNLTDAYEKNNKKYQYILGLLEKTFQKWTEVITNMSADGKINDIDKNLLLEKLKQINEATEESINIKIL